MVFGLLALVTLVLGWVVVHSGKPFGEEQLTAWAGLFVSIAALAVSLADLLPTLAPPADTAQLADDLAVTVREQWQEEITARNLRDPQVIPLSWSATNRPVAAPPASLVGSVAGRVLRLSLDGRLEGGFDAAAARLAEGYRRLDSGRLVILGEPGAGKTVLAAMLTLGLLAERASGAPVPVLLQVSGWDPVSVSLNDWMVAALAQAYYGGREDVPRRLLAHRRLLAVLDGLDEMPEASRRSAVRAIIEAFGEERGVVLTCRSVEYQDVVEGGSPVLRRAPVVEVAPVSVADGIAYLSAVSWPEGVTWEPVYERLRTDPDGPLATALSTPLALSLARTVYSNTGHDPADLLAFEAAHAVEDHLIDHLVIAAYAPSPGSCGQQADGAWLGKAERAERYLTFLATYLHRQRERDLHWWVMNDRLLPRSAGLVVGIVVTLTIMAAAAMVIVAQGKEIFGGSGVLLCVGGGVLAAITWYAAPHRPPGRLSFTRRGSLGRLRTGFTAGMKLSAILACPVVVTVTGQIAFSAEGWISSERLRYIMFLAAVVGVGLAVCLTVAVHAWLDAPPERSTGAGPLGLLRQDRASSVVGALAAGVALGLAVTPLLALAQAAVSMAVLYVTHTSFGLPAGAFEQLPTMNDAYPSTLVGHPRDLSDSAEIFLMYAASIAVLTVLTRAWLRFLLLRLFLAVRGKLPWRLMRFLADMRERQLLRQSAGAYQFRHIRLQERLASRSLAQDRAPRTPQSIARRRIRAAVALTATLLACGLTVRYALPDDPSEVVVTNNRDVQEMAFAPDMQHIVTMDHKGTLQSWNPRTGKEETSGSAQVPPRFMPDHRPPAVTAQKDGLLVIPHFPISGRSALLFPWDGAPSRLATLPLHFPSRLPSDALSLDGHYVPVTVSQGGRYLLIPRKALGNEQRNELRDTRTGKTTIVTLRAGDRGRTLLSADGERIVYHRPDARDWVIADTRKASDASSCSIPARHGFDGGVGAINAAGTRIATVTQGTIRIYDNLCHLMRAIETPWFIFNLALNDAGTELAASTNNATVLYRI
ncbi:NACHT domain-containing protein [Streptomyces noursei]|uniref:NACHT domain-containing protein n=1 Tax=Streptomyces noursei TaxID=1971 RepID=UPI0019641ADB|nr:NACHT domain-containing protein [Streptomyces noursei]QRX90819.1 NACHT domain-containing protein [Streptomyces noursei]